MCGFGMYLERDDHTYTSYLLKEPKVQVDQECGRKS